MSELFKKSLSKSDELDGHPVRSSPYPPVEVEKGTEGGSSAKPSMMARAQTKACLEGMVLEVEIEVDPIKDIHVKQHNRYCDTYTVSNAKKKRCEVNRRKCSPQEQEQFKQAKEKECDAWIGEDVLEILERKKIPNLTKDRIMRLRWVLTWKLVDGRRVIKARLTMRGFKDRCESMEHIDS